MFDDDGDNDRGLVIVTMFTLLVVFGLMAIGIAYRSDEIAHEHELKMAKEGYVQKVDGFQKVWVKAIPIDE